MAKHIPFITSEDGCKLAARHFPDSEIVRVPLDDLDSWRTHLPESTGTWLDAEIDGLHDLLNRESRWIKEKKHFPHIEEIADVGFQQQPNKDKVDEFVTAVLNACLAKQPEWITVPQLPMVNDSRRNKINRALAYATGRWQSAHRFSGRLILPLIATNQRQLNGKTERNRKVELADRCFQESQAHGIWVVDSTVTDEGGSATLLEKRFPGIIAFHEELNATLSPAIRIGGPYWGLNLVLWARQLIDYPAIGLGVGYQYFISGGKAQTPKSRVALHALRRRAGTNQLNKWLAQAILDVSPTHPAHSEFIQLKNDLPLLQDRDAAKNHVARFYKTWFELIAQTPDRGRSLALFQDLANAYTLGKLIKAPLDQEATARRPEAVAEPLMMSCL